MHIQYPQGRLSEPQRGTIRRSSDRAVIEAIVSSAFNTPVAQLRAATRQGAASAFARQCAMYLAHVVLGLNFSAVGRTFRRDRTTAAHACRLIEERREDPRIDAVIEALEAACRVQLSGLQKETRQ
jgi:chromosomal replication initiation ATPase DnaA